MTHVDNPYRDFEPPYKGGAVKPVLAADKQSFSVTSACPACEATMTRTVSRGLPFGNKGLWKEKPQPEPTIPGHVIMVCACGYAHAGRAADSTETGCGAAWKQPLA